MVFEWGKVTILLLLKCQLPWGKDKCRFKKHNFQLNTIIGKVNGLLFLTPAPLSEGNWSTHGNSPSSSPPSPVISWTNQNKTNNSKLFCDWFTILRPGWQHVAVHISKYRQFTVLFSLAQTHVANRKKFTVPMSSMYGQINPSQIKSKSFWVES